MLVEIPQGWELCPPDADGLKVILIVAACSAAAAAAAAAAVVVVWVF